MNHHAYLFKSAMMPLGERPISLAPGVPYSPQPPPKPVMGTAAKPARTKVPIPASPGAPK